MQPDPMPPGRGSVEQPVVAETYVLISDYLDLSYGQAHSPELLQIKQALYNFLGDLAEKDQAFHYRGDTIQVPLSWLENNFVRAANTMSMTWNEGDTAGHRYLKSVKLAFISSTAAAPASNPGL
jgi:hypothetical protein